MGSYWRSLLPGVLLLGVGLTLAVAPLTTAVMSSVPQEKTGVASAVNNALSRLAGLVAVSVLMFVLAHGFSARLADELEQVEFAGGSAAADDGAAGAAARHADSAGLTAGSSMRRPRGCWIALSSRGIAQ